MLGETAYLTRERLRELSAALAQAATAADPHVTGVATLTTFFGDHFPILCETLAEVIRQSGHETFRYWCDVAEMCPEYSNYHFTLDIPPDRAAGSE